jgi:hypothetical protein
MAQGSSGVISIIIIGFLEDINKPSKGSGLQAPEEARAIKDKDQEWDRVQRIALILIVNEPVPLFLS